MGWMKPKACRKHYDGRERMAGKETRRGRIVRSIAGGILIGIGGTAYLSVDDRALGAFLFATGLYAILATGQLLLTGRAAYTSSLRELTVVLAGNACGAALMGRLAGPEAQARAALMCQAKLGLGAGRLASAGILCNLLIYMAVEGYRKGQPLLTIMCVMTFILCGFEHSIANIFYFMAGRCITLRAAWFLAMNVLSNVLCGQAILLARTYLHEAGSPQ